RTQRLDAPWLVLGDPERPERHLGGSGAVATRRCRDPARLAGNGGITIGQLGWRVVAAQQSQHFGHEIALTLEESPRGEHHCHRSESAVWIWIDETRGVKRAGHH